MFTFLLIDSLLDNSMANALWFISLMYFETLWKLWPLEKSNLEFESQSVLIFGQQGCVLGVIYCSCN